MTDINICRNLISKCILKFGNCKSPHRINSVAGFRAHNTLNPLLFKGWSQWEMKKMILVAL